MAVGSGPKAFITVVDCCGKGSISRGYFMSNEVKIKFSELPWEAPGPGVRYKAFTRDGKKLRLVEFTNEFIEEDWCENGHIGYVLEGTLEVSFPERKVRFSAGNGVFILGGDLEKHKATVIGERVRLILVETV